MTAKLMTVKELAEALNVSESWVYNRVKKKQIPFVPLGNKRIRFIYSKVIRHLENESEMK